MKRLIALIFLIPAMAMATVTTTSNSVTYTCSGSTGPYSFTYSVDAASSLKVSEKVTATGVVTVLTITSDYTTSPVNNNYINGGSVTLVNACPTGDTMTIERVTPETQETHFYQNMPALYSTFESSLDKLTMAVQDNSVTTSGKAGVGDCSPNFVVATTTGGVTCGTPSGGGGAAVPLAGGTMSGALFAPNVNGEVNAASCSYGSPASWCSGSEMGAWINAAIAELGSTCGTVLVPAGTYSYSTTIVKPRCVTIKGQSGWATQLTYTGTTAAIVVGDTSAGSLLVGGLQDITFIGSGKTGGQIGIFFGGDPAGTLISSTAFGESQSLINVSVNSFQTALEWGNNAWNDTFLHIQIGNNGTAIDSASSFTNSGENISFFGSDIFNNNYVMNGSGIAPRFSHTSLDFNNDGTSTVLATHAQIVNSVYFCDECWAESWSGPVSSGFGFIWRGGYAQYDSAAAITDTSFWDVSGSGQNTSITNTAIYSVHAVTQALNFTAGGVVSLVYTGIQGNSNGDITAASNSPLAATHMLVAPGLPNATNINYINDKTAYMGFGCAANPLYPLLIGCATDTTNNEALIQTNAGHAALWEFNINGVQTNYLTANDTGSTLHGIPTGSFGLDASNALSLAVNGAERLNFDNFGAANFSSRIDQDATKRFAGTCTMATATSCTFTLLAAYNSTPVCVASPQGTTAIAGACQVVGTTVTITAASSNSEIWGAILIGNPN